MVIFLTAIILLFLFLLVVKKPIYLPFSSIIILAIAIRIVVTFLVFGVVNHDMTFRRAIATRIVEGKSIYYETKEGEFSTAYFPFAHYLDAAVLRLEKFGIPFIPTSKLVFTIFDIGIIVLLWKLKSDRNRTALIYAVNPISIMITNIHGQFDVGSVFFILLSIFFLKKNSEGSSHLAFTLAVICKTWPIFFVIPFLKKSKKRVQLLLFILLGISLFMISYSIVYNVTLLDIIYRMKGYVGLLGEWGYTSILYFTRRDFDHELILKWNVISMVFLFCFAIYSIFIKSRNILEELLILILIYFIFIPGFSTQWTIWVIPFLIVLKPKFWVVFIISMTIWISLFQTSWIITNTNTLLIILAATKVAGIYAWLITITMLIFWFREDKTQ